MDDKENDEVRLLNVKRLVRPSFSEASVQEGSVENVNLLETLPQEKATDPLIFKNLDFRDAEGFPSISNVTHEELKLFHEFLGATFDCFAVSHYNTFINIECDELPPTDQRPFSIGGFITLWSTPDTEQMVAMLGDIAKGPACEIEEPFLGQLNQNTIPPVSAVEYLANNIFPDCVALSFIDQTLVVEMPDTDEDAWLQALNTLPRNLTGSLTLWYHNGPLATIAHARRAIQPDPSHLQALIADETDYVARDGKMYPGVMVSSFDAQRNVLASVSAGLMVQKEQQLRMVCPYHLWQDLDGKYPGVFRQDTEQSRQIFSAAQGADGDKPGSVIGHLEQRLGDGDIGLVKVSDDLVFENVLMDTSIRPKTLLRLNQVELNDEFVFESFVTGSQRLRCLGRRFPFVRRRATAHPTLYSPSGKSHLLPSDSVAYVQLEQGVFATNTPVLKREPMIRDRVCGSMLVRCLKKGRKGTENVLELGEVGGMLHYSDLREKYYITPALLMYADAMDPLIDAGWKVSEA